MNEQLYQIQLQIRQLREGNLDKLNALVDQALSIATENNFVVMTKHINKTKKEQLKWYLEATTKKDKEKTWAELTSYFEQDLNLTQQTQRQDN